MTRHASCCVSFCTNNFRNSPGLAFYRIPKARRIQLFWLPSKEIISKAVSRCILLFFFFLSRYKIAPGTSSSFSFTFSCFFFQFHLPLCYFGCILLFVFFLSRFKITPGTSSFSFTFSCFFFQFHLPLCYFELKHFSSLSAMFVYIRVPANNPINAHAPSLGPRLSLFSDVSY